MLVLLLALSLRRNQEKPQTGKEESEDEKLKHRIATLRWRALGENGTE